MMGRTAPHDESGESRRVSKIKGVHTAASLPSESLGDIKAVQPSL